MKIIDVNEFYAEQGGGVRTYVNAKLEAASAAGHEMVIVAPGPQDAEEQRLGGRIIWVKGPPMPLDPRYFVMYREKAVHAILRKERADVIEGSSPWSGGWFAARYKGPGAKALIYHQDPVAVYPQTFLDRWLPPKRIDDLCFPYWRYVRKLAKHYDATVAAGQWLAERLGSFGVQRPEAVPFGIDRTLFSPGHASAEARKKWLAACGIPEHGRLLVTISRMHPEKRLGTLFKAVGQLQSSVPTGLVVFGDGPFRRAIESQANQVAGVHLAGFVSDRPLVAEALASADAMLHGSAAETFGFVIAEAMCSGCPIVAPDSGGAFDLVEPSFSETYRAGDVAACVSALQRLFARDRAELSKQAHAAAARKVNSPQDHFDALFTLYAKLAADQPT